MLPRPLALTGVTLKIQASVFNGCCKIYALRYRQSNVVYGLEQEGAEAIYSLGFQDIRNTFFQFVRAIDPSEPLILESQSQGTFHLIRLIDEEMDGSPLLI